MGVLKLGSFAILSFALFIALILLSSFMTMTSSLSIANVKEKFPAFAEEIKESSTGIKGYEFFNLSRFNIGESIDGSFSKMVPYCENYKDYVFVFEGQTIVIPCSTVSEGEEAVAEKTLADFAEGIYYEDYDCNFWDCLSKEELPFFLISEKSKDYWQGKFQVMLIVSLVIVALLFIVSESKANFLLATGTVFIVSAISFSKLSEFFIKFFSSESLALFSLFFNILFSRSGAAFWILTLIGLALLIGGVFLFFGGRGLMKKRLSKEELRKTVREELVKEKIRAPARDKPRQVKKVNFGSS